MTGHSGECHLGSVSKGRPANLGARRFDEWLSELDLFDNAPILSREGVAAQTKGESSMVMVDTALELICKHADRVTSVKPDLESWLAAVARSPNGKDYR